jgi:AcrR family transcriptional regulator
MTGSRPRAYDMTRRANAAGGTRRRIAEAALGLFKERDYDDVSLNEIARAADVSHQTVLNHCENKAGVLLAASELFSEEVRNLEADAIAGDVTSVVHTTCVRYEALGDANARWGAMSTRAPEVAEGLARGRLAFQSWLEEMLGDLLPPDDNDADDDPGERRRVLLGLHAALDVFTWKLLRRDLGLSQEQTEAQLTDLVLGVLARHRTPT